VRGLAGLTRDQVFAVSSQSALLMISVVLWKMLQHFLLIVEAGGRAAAPDQRAQPALD
jgi:hypothetical protein